MKIRAAVRQKTGSGYSTAGGRELRLKARPPARLALQSSTQKHIESKDKETKTTVPSGNSYFWHIESPSYPLPGNSYFWRTAKQGAWRKPRINTNKHAPLSLGMRTGRGYHDRAALKTLVRVFKAESRGLVSGSLEESSKRLKKMASATGLEFGPFSR